MSCRCYVDWSEGKGSLNGVTIATVRWSEIFHMRQESHGGHTPDGYQED
jgi:hypothetical protein